jgi:hypothetical protein
MRFAALPVVVVTALLATGSMATAQEIIVEVNGTDPAAGSFTAGTGDWDPSTAKSSAPGLSPSLGTLYVDGGEAALGVFEVSVPAAGLCEVQATRTVVQDGWGSSMPSNANQWISLGAYPFGQGATTITIAAQPQSQPPSTANAHRTYADAIRLVPEGGSTVAPQTAPVIEPAPSFIPADTPSPSEFAFPTAAEVEAAAAVTPPPQVPTPPQQVTPTADTAIAWHESLSLAKTESMARNRPLAVYAFNHRSRLSRTVTDTVMTNAEVVAGMNEMIPVQVDLQLHPQESGELSIYRVPTLILYSPQGQEIDRLVGRFTAEEVQTLLSRGF